MKLTLEIVKELHDFGSWNWEEIGNNIGVTPEQAKSKYYYVQNQEKKIQQTKDYYRKNKTYCEKRRKINYHKNNHRWALKNKVFINDIVVEYHDYASFNFIEIAQLLGIEPHQAYHKYVNGKNRERHNKGKLAISNKAAA